MNIQLSVIIWTVICFLALMLILKHLLFTPVLNLLDERKKKIEAAHEKKDRINAFKAENDKLNAQKREQAELQAKAQAKATVQKIQADGKTEIITAQRQCLENIKQHREDIKSEYDRIVGSAAPEMETVAAIFAKNIITHRT